MDSPIKILKSDQEKLIFLKTRSRSTDNLIPKIKFYDHI